MDRRMRRSSETKKKKLLFFVYSFCSNSTTPTFQGKLPPKKDAKLSFFVLPMEGSGLKEIVEGGKLTAEGIVRIKKVVSYIGNRLDINRDELGITPQTEPARYLVVLCNNQVHRQLFVVVVRFISLHRVCIFPFKIVPLDASLLTVKTFFWKSSGDVVLHYKLADEYAAKLSSKSN
jgi:hypothetical protein